MIGPMRIVRTIAEVLHLCALGVWAGAMGAVGAAAAIAFPMMRDLDPSLPAYAAYEGPHWSIAAGAVMNRVFALADTLGFVCACIAAATLVVVFVVRARPLAPMVIRAALVAGALGLAGHAMFVQGPAMRAHLHAYWEAAEAGEDETAAVHKEAFDAMHPRASGLIGAQLIVVLLAFGVGGWATIHEREARP